MLAEKFILILETLISRRNLATATYLDGSPRIISSSQFTPIEPTIGKSS
jgi:hypothetical protein